MRTDLGPVAILAGGKATRLGSLAADTPKALVDVAGEPFVVHQLRLLAAHGVRRVVLCVGHLRDMIRDALGDGPVVGVEIRYSDDGPDPLGTGGAVVKALPLLGPEFFVLYGDSYLEIDYGAAYDAFRRSGRLGLMTVLHNRSAGDVSNVRFEGGEIVRYDKRNPTPAMEHIDYGLLVFRDRAFAGRHPGEGFDLAEVCEQLVAAGQMAAMEVGRRFYEVGSVAGLAETRAYLAARRERPA